MTGPEDDDLERTHLFKLDEDDFVSTSTRHPSPGVPDGDVPDGDAPDWGERTQVFEGERLSAIHAAIEEVLSSSRPSSR